MIQQHNDINALSPTSEVTHLEDRRIELKGRRDKVLPYYIILPLVALLCGFLILHNPASLIVGGVATFISSLLYYRNFTRPFKSLVTHVKQMLIDKYMQIFHPHLQYQYSQQKAQVTQIIKQSKLITANRYKEEDVIVGKKNGVDFYISEINLIDENQDSKGNQMTTSIFKGLLLNLTFEDRVFPTSKIESQPNVLKRWFGETEEHPGYKFWYQTEDAKAFDRELKSLFPFIEYLANKQGDVRISAQGYTLTILIESDMDLLDTPTFQLDKSFLDGDYFDNFTRQLNTLFYFIETFGETVTDTEIENRLELKALELREQLDLMHQSRSNPS